MSTPTTLAAPVEQKPTLRATVTFGPDPSVSDQNLACDRCPTAPAKAHVEFGSGSLHLCGHHLREGWDQIMRSALSVTADEPGTLYHLPQRADFPGGKS